jgi:hypothetical protein
VWSTAHLKSAGKLRSDLNFEIWCQLTGRGMAVPQPVQVMPALPTVPSYDHTRESGETGPQPERRAG